MSVRDLTEEDSLGVRRSILWAVVSDTEVSTSEPAFTRLLAVDTM